MKPFIRLIRPALVVCVVIASPVLAQSPQSPPVLSDRPDADPQPVDARLGAVFESRAAGIAFRGPADCKETRRSGAGDELVQYTNDQKKWLLRVARSQFGQPLPLTDHKDEKGKSQSGLLAVMVDRLKLDKPGAEILRDDILTIGDAGMGMIAARYNLGTETFLHQQALVRASDRSYFVFTLTSPAPRSGDVSQDRGVQEAVAAFNAVLDSIRLIDQTELRQDQDQRLYRTRALFLNVNETRLRNELVAQQWLRLMRDGKDIGYMYVVEETSADLPRKRAGAGARKPVADQGVLIGMRSRTRPDAGIQVDAESWMWMSFDRRHEKWSTIASIASGDKRDLVSEFGASDREISRVLEKGARGGEVRSDGSVDANQPPVRSEETYALSVTHFSKSATAQPIKRELPVFYLPQAMGHLLPRLLPRFEQKGYMFATYVTDLREVMARYIDVGREQEVTLDGQRVAAIPIRDRIGFEGSVTTHYVSPDGKYLGSLNADSGITILPTDAATLVRLWKDANLTRPADVDEKK